MYKVLVVSSYYFVTLRACMNRYAIKHTERKQLELWNKFHNFKKPLRIFNFFYFLMIICIKRPINFMCYSKPCLGQSLSKRKSNISRHLSRTSSIILPKLSMNVKKEIYKQDAPTQDLHLRIL